MLWKKKFIIKITVLSQNNVLSSRYLAINFHQALYSYFYHIILIFIATI